MFNFRKKTKTDNPLVIIESMKSDLDALKKDMTDLRSKMETEIDVVKRNFDALVRFIQEGHTEGEKDDTDQESPMAGLTENDVQNMKQDILYMKRGIMDILEWTQTLDPEFKTVHNHIDEARKDVKNKIAYAVSRLKT